MKREHGLKTKTFQQGKGGREKGKAEVSTNSTSGLSSRGRGDQDRQSRARIQKNTPGGIASNKRERNQKARPRKKEGKGHQTAGKDHGVRHLELLVQLNEKKALIEEEMVRRRCPGKRTISARCARMKGDVSGGHGDDLEIEEKKGGRKTRQKWKRCRKKYHWGQGTKENEAGTIVVDRLRGGGLGREETKKGCRLIGGVPVHGRKYNSRVSSREETYLWGRNRTSNRGEDSGRCRTLKLP